MAMGIPVITNAGVGDVEEITTKYNAGIVLKDFTAMEFEKAVGLIVEGKKFDKEEILRGTYEYYALGNAIQKYLSVYKKILG